MAVNVDEKKPDDLADSLGGQGLLHGELPPVMTPFSLNTSELNHEHNQRYVDIPLDQCDTTEQFAVNQTSRNKQTENSSKKRHRQKSHVDSSSDNSRGKSASPGRSAKHNSKRYSQENKSTSRQGESVRSDSAGLGLLSSPTPSHGSGNEAGDVGFKASLLDEVLTEKKMSLLRSAEVKAFLQQQQAQTALNKISSIKKL